MSFIREYAKQKETIIDIVDEDRNDEIVLTNDEDDLNRKRQSEKYPTRQETPLGQVAYGAVRNAIVESNLNTVKKYTHYSDEDRYMIAQYASKNGSRPAARHFKKTFPKINESTVRGFLDRYRQQRAEEKAGRAERLTVIVGKKRGRPLMLGPLDEQIQGFLLALRSRGGGVNRTIAMATARALIESSSEDHLRRMKITEGWAQSLFRRMGFKRRAATTAKVPIPEKARKEIELVFMHKIVRKVEKYEIPDSLIINIDQTPTKFVPVGKSTLAKKGSKHVPLAGSGDKRMITATFSETLDGQFLAPQLIYKGKTDRSLPNIEFPPNFSLSTNEKHYSNTDESIKLLHEIIVPYVESERIRLDVPDQMALIIWDVFRGQKTDSVLEVLQENNITTEYVPNNLTNYYQPLDCTTNKWAKDFTKRKFSAWYAKHIREQLARGVPLEQIDIKFQLTTMKPLHAQWMIDLYNEMTTLSGKDVVIAGWKQSGIFHAIRLGSANLPTLDPFQEVDPLDSDDNFALLDTPVAEINPEYGGDGVDDISSIDSDSDSDGSDWEEMDVDFRDGNAFDNFVEEE